MPNILFLSNPELFSEKTSLYLRVREQEGRVLSDEQVAVLPRFIPETKNQAYLQREWSMRARSFQRFKQYLNQNFANRPLSILDLGCGTGWLSIQLSKRPETELWAVDVNLPELEQGARVAAASGLLNIHFVFTDVLENAIPEKMFNLVVLSASVQYFPNLPDLVSALKQVLKPGGEIHFLDSPFYPSEAKRQKAKTGTLEYYTKLGVPEMATWYHHHLLEDICELGGKNLNTGLEARVLQHLHLLPPFPWILL